MMAGLRSFKSIAFFCGATIISDRYALTAAICVNNKTAKDIALVVGEHDRSRGIYYKVVIETVGFFENF